MTTPLPVIGLFYGSTTCYTEMAAEKIRDQLAPYAEVILHNIADTPLTTMQQYTQLIVGIPTWDYGELQEDWDMQWDELMSLDLHGRSFAVYGLGDQAGYPEWFQDAAGWLHDALRARGATPCGYWPTTGYVFTGSRALTTNGTQFVCLALDDAEQSELTDERIAQWCKQLAREFVLG